MASANSLKHQRRRLDRMLMRTDAVLNASSNNQLVPHEIELVGTQKIGLEVGKKNTNFSFPSDHYGLKCGFFMRRGSEIEEQKDEEWIQCNSFHSDGKLVQCPLPPVDLGSILSEAGIMESVETTIARANVLHLLQALLMPAEMFTPVAKQTGSKGMTGGSTGCKLFPLGHFFTSFYTFLSSLHP